MSTLKTHNLQSPDAGSVNISLAPNAGMVVAGLSTYSNQINVGSNIKLGSAGIITATSLDISGDIDVDGHTELDNINISGVSTHVGLSQFQNTINLTHASAGQNYIYFNEDLQFAKNGTGTRLKIDSSGSVLLGHTASVPTGGSATAHFKLQVQGTGFDSSGIFQQRYQNGSAGASLYLGHSRGGIGVQTALQQDDEVGKVAFVASDGTDFAGQAGRIQCKMAANATSDNTPGYITINTCPSGSNSTLERVRINSDGAVNIGNAYTVAPWGASGNVNTGVRLVNNGLTGYAISANSNDIAGIFNRTNTQGAILECKYNGQVVSAIGDNYTTFTGQKNTFRYDNAGGVGAYLSLQNRSSTANTAVGIAFGVDNSDASMTSSDYANGQIKVRNDGSGGGILSFNVHTGGNFEALKIVGNLHNTRNATNGNTVAMKGGVAFSCAGIAIDKSWDNYPGLHVFNTTGHSDTNQGQFRFHGWNTSYNSYPLSSGSDFSVNLVCDGTGLTSDERRKTGISTITNALNTVSQLRGVKYTQVNRELEPQTHMTMDNGQKLGFVAQEVIPHLPSIVIDSGDHVQPMENGYCDRYMIDYGSVVALLTEAIKELKSKNEALEARIASLESS